jgi:Xaa-Pro aminopeptidase
MTTSMNPTHLNAPFDTQKLDRLLEEHEINVLIASSKHNTQYLLGGYRFFFFEAFDAIGVSRYLPLLVYFRNKPDQTTYLGNRMEAFEEALDKFWVPRVVNKFWGTRDAIQGAAEVIRSITANPGTIAIESAFLPADAYQALAAEFPNSRFVDGLVPLERLRAVKTTAELRLVKEASERVVAAMLAAFAKHAPGATKNDLVQSLRLEEVARGLKFEYCLVTAGTNTNRAPSDQPWRAGEIASLDSGGNLEGYIGDLCRMGILGQPDNELEDFLAEVDAIQMAARKPIRAGAMGASVFEEAQRQLNASPHRANIDFMAHGMGLISHEAPRLTGRGAVPYPGDDAMRPLEAGMVISIETTLIHPVRGFIKLEDTVAVTETGWEAYGDAGRGWNIAGK